MGIVINQGLKASIASYIGVFLGAFNSLYLFPKVIGAEGIGVINVISASATLFLPLLQLGFTTSLVKYFPVFKDRPYFGTFITYSLIIPLFALMVFLIFWPVTKNLFSLLFEQNAGLIFENIHWIVPLTALLVVFGLLEALSKANFKIIFPTFVRNVVWRISMTAGVLLIALDYLALDDVSLVLTGAWVVSLVFLVVNMLSGNFLKFGWEKSFLKSDRFKEFNSFSGFVILLSLGGYLIQSIDKIMVASYLGDDAAGVFSTAMYFATLIEIPKRSVMGIISPVLVDSFKKDDLQKVDETYKKSSLNLLLIGGILFIMVWINVWDIFAFIPEKEEFISGLFVVFYYCLAKVIDMGMGCNSEIMVYSKYYKMNIPLQIILIGVVMATNAVFIPIYGITGAAIATCVSILTYNVLRYLFLFFKMGIQPFTKATFYVVIILSVFMLGGLMLNFNYNPFLNIILRSTIIGIPLFLIVYRLKLSTEINDTLNGLLKKFKLK